MVPTKYSLSTSRVPSLATRRALLSEFHHFREEPKCARSPEDSKNIYSQLQQIEDVWTNYSGENKFEDVFGDIAVVELRDMLSRWYIVLHEIL